MAVLHHFDEDVVLNSTHADSVITNRSAAGPITVFLPDDAPAGFTVEIHQVEPYAVTVSGQSAGDDLLGSGQAIILPGRGRGVRLAYAAPHVWTGYGL